MVFLVAVLCLEIISDGPESIDKLYSWAIQEIDDVFIYTLSSQCLYIFIYNNFEITCIIAIKLSWHSAAMFRCNQNTKRDKTFFTPDLRYFVIRFPDSGQSQPEMAEIRKAGYLWDAYTADVHAVWCRPKDVQDFARRSHVTSATVLRISEKPWDIRKIALRQLNDVRNFRKLS